MKLLLDYDKFTLRMEDTFYMLKDIPKPFDVRLSPGMEGLHLRKEDNYTYDDPLYHKYDDPRRLHINRLRQQNGVSHGILWNKKKNSLAGTWHTMRNNVDILSFMTKLHELSKNALLGHYSTVPMFDVIYSTYGKVQETEKHMYPHTIKDIGDQK